MKPDRAISLIEKQRSRIPALKQAQRNSAEFAKWRRDTEIAIARIFGESGRHINDFTAIRYSLSAFSSATPDSAFQEAYVRGLDKADAILASMIDEIEEYEVEEGEDAGSPDVLNLIERLCLRFHSAARQLQTRHSARPTLTIEDEYDVQDLLHAILRLHFDDVRPEEVAPSYAGASSRLDFLLKRERVVIEVKKTRKSMKAGDLGEQLIIDRARYEAHPDCDTLVCFVYDPEGRIGNPVGIERDLESGSSRLKVRVIIAPKN